MPYTFFGPWQVVTAEIDGSPSQGFLISGSDNSDGFYRFLSSAPIDMPVTGSQWNIDLQLLWPADPPVDWASMPAQTKMAVLPDVGLAVELEFEWFDKTVTAPFLLQSKLRCISKDSALNPIDPGVVPPDFTLPGLG